MLSQSNMLLILFISIAIVAIKIQFIQCKSPSVSTVNKNLYSQYLFKIPNNRVSRAFRQHQTKQSNFYQDPIKSINNQVKRELTGDSQRPWLSKNFNGQDDIMNMHAFVIRDEHIPPCCTAAEPISNTRYFMCSGSILTVKHAITSASCMHFADVYEHHINAELAILSDALSPMPSVIKINRFEMHPSYDYDVESSDLSTYDLAILFLNCSLSATNVIVPRLPKGFYDDIGHVCCGKNCKLITIIQSADNHHVAKILAAKYLPSPIHEITNSNNTTTKYPSNKIKKRMYETVNNMFYSSNVIQRAKRNPGKLAGTPPFFVKPLEIIASQNESENISKSMRMSKLKMMRNIFDEIANARREITNKSVKNEDYTIKRINSVVDMELETSSKKNENYPDIFTRVSVLTSPDDGNKLTLPPDSIDNENNLNSSPRKYVECPPLGTPIFKDGLLIAMIAYTCDDVQNWVEWKYVSISKNINWIRKRISITSI